jgi:DNA-binding XRE family transcriptional regulator
MSTDTLSKLSTTPNYRSEALTMAVAVIVDRIKRLPTDDKDDLNTLFKELMIADGDEEQESIVSAIREILDQSPVTARQLEAEPPKRLLTWMKHTGARIKALRDQAGLTQTQLAEKAGLPQSHICRLETGAHSPTRMTLEKLAAALEIDIELLDAREPS